MGCRCWKVGWYCDSPSGPQEEKELNFSLKIYGFCFFVGITWNMIAVLNGEVLNGFYLYLSLFKPFNFRKIRKTKKLNFWDSKTSRNFKHQHAIKLDIIGNLIKYSFKKVDVKVPFTLTAFEILLLVGRLILWPVQQGSEKERVKW